jgi:hypothetical protein
MSQDPILRPDGQGGVPTEVPSRGVESGTRPGLPDTGDYRDQLRSRRWDAAPLRNPEVEKTDPRIAVAFIVLLCVLTLVLLVVGYGSGFWSMPA